MTDAFNEAKAAMDALYDRRAKDYANRKAEHGRVAPIRTGGPAPSRTSQPPIDISTEEGQDQALDAIFGEAEG
jgi:hypothetical protein